MADNTVVQAASDAGDTFRTLEDTDTIKWPVGVVAYATSVGTPDALQIVTITAGLPVQPMTSATWACTQSGSWSVTVSGTVTVGSHAVTNAGTFVVQVDGTALTRLTDIETNTDSGAVVGNGAAATAQRVTLANDSTGIVALTTSSATIGKLAANSGVDIGDVDVTSVPTDPFGANADAASATGSISAKLRFIASTGIPITGTVTVGSHAVTNAGTFAVQESGGALTALQVIDDWDESDRAKVNIIAGQAGVSAGAGAVDATTQRVTLASDDPAVASLALLDNAVSGNEFQCDVLTLPNVTLAAGTNTNEVVGDVAEDSALAGNPVRVGMRASQAIPSAMSGDGDVVTPWGDRVGRQVVKQQSGTGTTSQVADTGSSTTLLAANTSRLGCSIQNDSSAVLYLKCGATASATDYTARLVQYAYWEAPYGYTGVIDGIWASDPGDGAARVTEFT